MFDVKQEACSMSQTGNVGYHIIEFERSVVRTTNVIRSRKGREKSNPGHFPIDHDRCFQLLSKDRQDGILTIEKSLHHLPLKSCQVVHGLNAVPILAIPSMTLPVTVTVSEPTWTVVLKSPFKP